MKKLNLLIILFFACFFIFGCEGGNNNSGTSNNNGNGETNNESTSNAHILNENYEMHKILHKYDQLTEVEISYVYIGYYPQTEIKDEKIIKALKAIKTTNERGYIEYEGHEFLEYKVVRNHKYVSDAQNTDEIYENGTGYKPGTTHYFLVQPIAWKVLYHDTEKNTYFLQTEMIIDSRAYHSNSDSINIDGVTYYATNYEHSEIRKWLNEDFIDLCFTEEEKAFLQETLNDNEPKEDGYNHLKIPNDQTTDLCFLLGLKDAGDMKYNFYNGLVCDKSRFATATDLSNAKGLIKHVITGKTTSIWMTRTTNEPNRYMINYIGYDGLGVNDFYCDASNVGIRPCITVKFE